MVSRHRVASLILNWLKQRGATGSSQHENDEDTSRPRPVMSGPYLLLYEYLEHRYARRVILTFAEIEDLLGFALPALARLDAGWWTDGALSDDHSDSWVLASRTAAPNMAAHRVVFDRAL